MNYWKKVALYEFMYETKPLSFTTEMCKVSNGLSAPIMKDIFPINKKCYTLRHNSQFLDVNEKLFIMELKVSQTLDQKYGICWYQIVKKDRYFRSF